MEPRYTDRGKQWQWQWRATWGDGGRAPAGVIPGVILVSIGALFLLNNLQIFDFHDIWRYWPAILIAVGMLKLVDSNYSSGRAFGAILVAAGGILLAQTMGFILIRKEDLWPLILIAGGLWLLFQRTMNWSSVWSDRGRPVTAGTLHGIALFSGGKRRIADPDFKGGEVSAVFGGYEIDLRKASIQGDSAVLELNVIFGGVEIRIPETWSAVVEAAGVFGGISDQTVHPDESAPSVKRLVIRGSAIFGGVEIKN